MDSGDTLNMTYDLTNEVTPKINILRNVSQQLFEKLRGTAQFLFTMLDKLEENQDAEMVKFISDIRLELDKSIQEPQWVFNESKIF